MLDPPPSPGEESCTRHCLLSPFLISPDFTWILAFFAVEHHNPVFQYLFSVCIALQGISVFVIYCTREQHVRNIWRKLGRCPRNASQRCSDSSASSVGTLSSTLKTSLDNKPTIETEKDIYITAPGKTV